jgi:hypothetical protein
MAQESSSKEQKAEPEITYKQAMEMMKDPKVLAAAAAMHGFQLQAPGQQRKEEPEEKLEAPKGIELGEDASTKDVLSALQKLIQDNNAYLLKHIERSGKDVDKKLQSYEYKQQANEVTKFIKTHKHAEKLLPDMDAFWKKGDTLDEAYEKAKKLHNITEEETAPAKSPVKDSAPANPPKKSPRIAEEAGDDSDREPVAPKSIDEAARNSLKDMIAKNPDVQKLVSADYGMDDMNERVGE